MGILRSIESRIEGAFEGTFGRAFRANVEPVELARKLAKELEDHKVVSVSQTYAPTSYTVYLHPKDRERFSEYEVSLRTELAVYLAEHARREGYAMTTRPRVVFETEPALALGTFGIATEIGEAEEPPAEPAEAAPAPVEPAAEEPEPAPAAEEPPAEPAAAGVPPAPPAAEAVPVVPPPLPLPVPVPADVGPPPGPEAGADEDAATVHYTAAEAAAAAPSPGALVVDGRRVSLGASAIVIGRSSSCDVVIDDANASRRHAEVRRQGAGAVLVDLESTNGTSVNGQRVREHPLVDGDRITIGTTTISYETA